MMRAVEQNGVGPVDLHCRSRSLTHQAFKSDIQRKSGASAGQATDVDVDPIAGTLSVEFTIDETHLEVGTFNPQGIPTTWVAKYNHFVKLKPLVQRPEIVIRPSQMDADPPEVLEVDVIELRVPQARVNQGARVQKESVLTGISGRSQHTETGEQD